MLHWCLPPSFSSIRQMGQEMSGEKFSRWPLWQKLLWIEWGHTKSAQSSPNFLKNQTSTFSRTFTVNFVCPFCWHLRALEALYNFYFLCSTKTHNKLSKFHYKTSRMLAKYNEYPTIICERSDIASKRLPFSEIFIIKWLHAFIRISFWTIFIVYLRKYTPYLGFCILDLTWTGLIYGCYNTFWQKLGYSEIVKAA